MDKLSLIGRFSFALYREGRLELAKAGKNLVVASGKNRAALVLAGALTPLGAYLAIGDSAIQPVESQIALQGSEVLARSLLFGVVAGNIFTQSATVANAGAPVTVREMGIFSDLVAGTMISRWLPGEFTFATGDSLDFNWDLEVG